MGSSSPTVQATTWSAARTWRVRARARSGAASPAASSSGSHAGSSPSAARASCCSRSRRPAATTATSRSAAAPSRAPASPPPRAGRDLFRGRARVDRDVARGRAGVDRDVVRGRARAGRDAVRGRARAGAEPSEAPGGERQDAVGVDVGVQPCRGVLRPAAGVHLEPRKGGAHDVEGGGRTPLEPGVGGEPGVPVVQVRNRDSEGGVGTPHTVEGGAHRAHLDHRGVHLAAGLPDGAAVLDRQRVVQDPEVLQGGGAHVEERFGAPRPRGGRGGELVEPARQRGGVRGGVQLLVAGLEAGPDPLVGVAPGLARLRGEVADVAAQAGTPVVRVQVAGGGGEPVGVAGGGEDVAPGAAQRGRLPVVVLHLLDEGAAAGARQAGAQATGHGGDGRLLGRPGLGHLHRGQRHDEEHHPVHDQVGGHLLDRGQRVLGGGVVQQPAVDGVA